MSNHTQGPWHIGLRTAHSKRDVYGTQGELIALADAVFTDLATAQANAQLIAAAPELLEVLKSRHPFEICEQQGCDVCAVIRKAEGKD